MEFINKEQLIAAYPKLVAEIEVEAINKERDRTKECIQKFRDPETAIKAILANEHYTPKEKIEAQLAETKKLVYNSPEAQEARDKAALDEYYKTQ